MRDEIAQLAKALEPSFTAPEDAELAATMMVTALRDELGQPATKAHGALARWLRPESFVSDFLARLRGEINRP